MLHSYTVMRVYFATYITREGHAFTLRK